MSSSLSPPVGSNERISAAFYFISATFHVEDEALFETASVFSAMMDYWDALVRCDEDAVWDHYCAALVRVLQDERARRQSVNDTEEDWKLHILSGYDDQLSSDDATFHNGTVVPPSTPKGCPLPECVTPPTRRRTLLPPSSPAAYLIMAQGQGEFNDQQWEEDTQFLPRPA
jgi:hypothetical protein